ncbi:fasciclin domain-containing protein [Virgisporangium ochraceum]|nr:fasciclin domain-containing protein [Virgisporangium ochraceum]
MKLARLARRLFVGAVAASAATTLTLTATPSVAWATGGSAAPSGTRSLAAVLTSDTSGFDRRPHDFDILTSAVLAVLSAKPTSPVKVLTDGTVALTAFVPNDAAFQRLVQDITDSRRCPSEEQAFTAVAGLGIDTVEAVLLYHVVPGATIDGKTARRSDGAALTTAAGSTVTVDVKDWHVVRLVDKDTNDRDARVASFDINKGNKQIAHAIDRVLRPSDLP